MVSLPNFSGLIGLWLLFQVLTSVISSLVMIYVLFCLGKTAASMDRLATAVEKLVEHQAEGSSPQARSIGSGLAASYPASGYGMQAPPPVSPQTPSSYPPPPVSQPASSTTPSTTGSEFSSGPNVPYIPRREVSP